MGTNKFLQLAILTCLVVQPMQAVDQAYIKRGNPERHGRAWVERSEFGGPVREGARLILRTDVGSVVVRPTSTNRVDGVVTLRAYTGSESDARRLFGACHLSVRTVEGGGVYLTADSCGRHNHHESFGADFEVNVPVRFNLDVETQGGDVSIEGPLQGDARLTTAGGDVRTSDISGMLRIQTAGGSITTGSLGGRVDARTAGGSIHVGDVKSDAVLQTSGGEIDTGQVNGNLRAETAGGDLVLGGATGQIVAQTAGGQIQIGNAQGGVRAETAGGSIRLQGARGRVVAETAGGSIDLLQVEGAVRASTAAGRILAQWLAAGKRGFGASTLESAVGDIYVYLPVDVSLTVDASIDAAAGHQIVSDFPLTIQGDSESFVQRTIRGHGPLNGGGELLRIRTVSGNIEIRKLTSQAMEDLKNREAASWQKWQQQRDDKERRRHQREQQRRERQKQQQQQDNDDDN